MATVTPNFNLNKPAVGGDENMWGNQLNSNMDIIDTQMALLRSTSFEGVTRVPSVPKGTGYTAGAVAGGLKITLPFLKAHTGPVSFWVDIYDHDTKDPVSMFLSGWMLYAAPNATWYNARAGQVGGSAPIPVVFGDDGVNRAVLIGDTGGVWTNATTIIRDVIVLDGLAATARDTDWNITSSAVVLAGASTFTPSIPGTREPIIDAGTAAQYWRGDKTWQTRDKTSVGLANVDNTSDVNKPVSTAQQTALNLKANLVSPTFTGAPAAPTAVAGTNTTQLATTAFVAALGALKAGLNSPTFTGVPAAPTAAAATNTTQIATTAMVQAAIAASPKQLNESLAYGAVGQYVFASCSIAASTGVIEGSTYAGSSLVPAGIYAVTHAEHTTDTAFHVAGSTVLSGTWRALGRARNSGTGASAPMTTLFVRIS